jgi:hypothetical protein
MAAKVINYHSPDGKNTYELTFTRDSVEAAERAGFQIGQYTQMINLLSNSRALFYGAFIARNKGIKRKAVDEMFEHTEAKEELMAALLEMFMDASKSLLATDTEDKTAKNATWEIV